MANSHAALSVIIVVFLFGNVCGQCNSTTEPLELTATGEPQYLTSPNYPNDYDPYSDCEWRLVSSGEPIIVNVEFILTEGCTYDYLEIYDGYNISSTYLGKFCTDTFDAHVSTGQYMYFTFHSDSSIEASGFNILYFVANPAFQYDCGSTLIVDTTVRTFESSNLPYEYAGDIDCSWTFVATNSSVLIKLLFLDLQTTTNCISDSLTFYDGDSTNATEITKLCSDAGVYMFDDIMSTGDVIFVTFTTDASTGGLGFKFTFEEFSPSTTTSTTSTTTAPSVYNSECESSPAINVTAEFWVNYITSPNYGNSYSNYQTCHWLITAPSDYAVTLQFDPNFYVEYHSYCGYDYVDFYDGNSTSASRINRFCGTSAPTTVYRTSDNVALIVFKTDYSVTKTGFKVGYAAVDNSYPACKEPYTSYPVTYNLNMGWDQVYSTISSPGYNGYSYYASNTDAYWLFTNNRTDEYKMVLEFTYMDTESSFGCVYDSVILYNGACKKNGEMDKSCGRTRKRYELTGTEYLLQFHSDALYNRRGFTMQYYALALPSTLPPTTTTTTNGPPIGVVVDTINELLANYSSDILPNRDLSSPIYSSIDFYLVGINGIDEVEQKMTSTGQFVVKWVDGSMNWDPSRRSNIRKVLLPQNDLWRPDIALMNGFSEMVQMGADFMYIDVDYTGNCLWKPYQIMESVCKIDMTNYPYDIQHCALQFGTWSSSDKEVETEMGTSGLSLHEDFQGSSDWELLKYSAEEVTINLQKTIKFTFTLKRNPSYVTFYITIPTVMLAFMNVFTFVIPSECGEKSGFSITIFLSFIVVMIVVKGNMPDTSETVSLYAVYLLILTFLSALALVICVTQIRMLTFDESGRKMSSILQGFVKKINKLQKRLMCTGQPKEVRNTPNTASSFEYGTLEGSNSADSLSIESVDSEKSQKEYSSESEESELNIFNDDDDLEDGNLEHIEQEKISTTKIDSPLDGDSSYIRTDSKQNLDHEADEEEIKSTVDSIDNLVETRNVTEGIIAQGSEYLPMPPFEAYPTEVQETELSGITDHTTGIIRDQEFENIPPSGTHCTQFVNQTKPRVSFENQSGIRDFEARNEISEGNETFHKQNKVIKGQNMPNIFQEETFFRENCQLRQAVKSSEQPDHAIPDDEVAEYKAGRPSSSQGSLLETNRSGSSSSTGNDPTRSTKRPCSSVSMEDKDLEPMRVTSRSGNPKPPINEDIETTRIANRPGSSNDQVYVDLQPTCVTDMISLDKQLDSKLAGESLNDIQDTACLSKEISSEQRKVSSASSRRSYSLNHKRPNTAESNGSKQYRRLESSLSYVKRRGSALSHVDPHAGSAYSRYRYQSTDSGKGDTRTNSAGSRVSQHSNLQSLKTLCPDDTPIEKGDTQLTEKNNYITIRRSHSDLSDVFHMIKPRSPDGKSSKLARSQSVMSRNKEMALRPVSVLTQQEIQLRRSISRARRNEPDKNTRTISRESARRAASILSNQGDIVTRVEGEIIEAVPLTTFNEIFPTEDPKQLDGLKKNKSVRFPDQMSGYGSRADDEAYHSLSNERSSSQSSSLIDSDDSPSAPEESIEHSESNEKEDGEITWADLVICSDFVCFIIFFVATSVLTLALFVRMSMV